MADSAVRVWNAEDLASLPRDRSYEIVDGELIELGETGLQHNWIVRILLLAIDAYGQQTHRGVAIPAQGFRLQRGPDRFRRPDLSYYSLFRLPGGGFPDGVLEIAPDLAVEVLSENDTYAELGRRVADLIRAGTSLVWVIDPFTQTAQVHRAGASPRLVGPESSLDGEDVLPGFGLALATLFAPPPWSRLT